MAPTHTQRLFLYPLAAAVLAVSVLAAPSPGASLEVADAPSTEKEGGRSKPLIDVSAKSLGVLYNNRDNPVLQQFALKGELAVQWAAGTSDRGSYGSWDLPADTRWGDLDMRRWRLGVESRWLDSVRLWGTIDVTPHWDPFYKDIYECAASYSFGKELTVSAGKLKPRFFSQEYHTPSRELIVFETALLVGALTAQPLTGTWINGKTGKWVYAAAAYAGDNQEEFTTFDAGTIVQGSLGYDFASASNMDKALLTFNYQGSTSARNSDGPGLFSNALSLNTTLQNGCFYGYTDILAGIGRDSQSNVWGVVLTPTYFFIPNKLQGLLRYNCAHGDDTGLKLRKRYESLAPEMQRTKGVGSDYNAVYLGLNYYVYGHNCKLMTGVEYNDMSGGKQTFSGWTYLAGVRVAY